MTRRKELLVYLGLLAILIGAFLIADHLRTGVLIMAFGMTLVIGNILERR